MNPQIELLTKLHYYLTNWTLFRPLFHRPPPRISLPLLLLLFLFLLIMMMIGAYLQFYQPPPQTKTHTPNNNKNKTKMLLDNGTTIAECRWCEAKLSRPKDWELSESASLWTSRPDWDSRWHVREDGKWRIYSISSLYASSSLSRLTTGGGQNLWLWLREIDWPDILCISNHNDEEVPGESSKSPEWNVKSRTFSGFYLRESEVLFVPGFRPQTLMGVTFPPTRNDQHLLHICSWNLLRWGICTSSRKRRLIECPSTYSPFTYHL